MTLRCLDVRGGRERGDYLDTMRRPWRYNLLYIHGKDGKMLMAGSVWLVLVGDEFRIQFIARDLQFITAWDNFVRLKPVTPNFAPFLASINKNEAFLKLFSNVNTFIFTHILYALG